jgi:hypothetical protein
MPYSGFFSPPFELSSAVKRIEIRYVPLGQKWPRGFLLEPKRKELFNEIHSRPKAAG